IGGAAEESFTVLFEQFAGGIKMGVMPNAGEDIQYLATKGLCVKHAIGGQQWQVVLRSQLTERFHSRFFAAKLVALDFNEEMLRAENAQEFFQDRSRAGVPPAATGVSPAF